MHSRKYKNLTRAALVLVVLFGMALPAVAQVEVTFEGYAKYAVPFGGGIDAVGAVMDVYGYSNPPTTLPTPVDMDYVANQYTVHVSEMTVATYEEYNLAGLHKVVTFNGGVLRIYQDAKAGGTAADFANPATFTDGTLLLEGNVADGWVMDLSDPFGMGGFSGAGSGYLDFVGGAGLTEMNNLGGPDYLTKWTFAGTGISDPTFFVSVPDGYQRIFGIKLFYPGLVPNDEGSWGEVKNLYR